MRSPLVLLLSRLDSHILHHSSELLQSSPPQLCHLLFTYFSNSRSSLYRGSPKLNRVFKVQSHQCCVQGHSNFPGPADHTISDAGQNAIGVLGLLSTMLAYVCLGSFPGTVPHASTTAWSCCDPKCSSWHSAFWMSRNLDLSHRFSNLPSFCFMSLCIHSSHWQSNSHLCSLFVVYLCKCIDKIAAIALFCSIITA